MLKLAIFVFTLLIGPTPILLAQVVPQIVIPGKEGSKQVLTQGDPDEAMVEQASKSIKEGQPAAALAVLDKVIADEAQRYAGEKRLIFSARSSVETILYLGIAMNQKRDALVLGQTWSLALFLKGYALVDLGSADQSKAYFDQAIAMAPRNSQYLGELGEWFKARKDWLNAAKQFEAASSAAEFSPDTDKSFDKRRALRGMGFVLTEQGNLDDAEKIYRECLKLDATDEGAKHELNYIEQQRARLRKES